MHNLYLIEECYKKYIKNLSYWIPEGIYNVNLLLLQQLDLLHFYPSYYQEESVTGNFQIIETPEKITLINDQFVVWVITDQESHSSCVLIALNREDYPHLETAFVASGVYNTSKLVLKVLEKFLFEIAESERVLKSLR